MPRFEKGHKKIGGKTKGTPNKLTTTFKELVVTTMEKLQDKPKVNLEEWAEANPTEFYKIASKLIPTEVEAKVQNFTGIPRSTWADDSTQPEV